MLLSYLLNAIFDQNGEGSAHGISEYDMILLSEAYGANEVWQGTTVLMKQTPRLVHCAS
jgi:hypothetical protein